MGEVLKVKLLHEGARVPSRATVGATGLDLYACIEGSGYLEVGVDVVLVPTGVAIEAPVGVDVQIRPRSGLSRSGVNVILGTLDADYRGEVLVAMHCFGSKTLHRVQDGDRIAQLVVARLEPVELEVVEELSESERGIGGHGSTGR